MTFHNKTINYLRKYHLIGKSFSINEINSEDLPPKPGQDHNIVTYITRTHSCEDGEDLKNLPGRNEEKSSLPSKRLDRPRRLRVPTNIHRRRSLGHCNEQKRMLNKHCYCQCYKCDGCTYQWYFPTSTIHTLVIPLSLLPFLCIIVIIIIVY